jgi:hypothetical protein
MLSGHAGPPVIGAPFRSLNCGKCWFYDVDGRKWAVRDVATTKRGKIQRLELMSDWSTHRVFVPEEGPSRWYKFVRREGGGLSTGHLKQQWEAAELRLAGVA